MTDPSPAAVARLLAEAMGLDVVGFDDRGENVALDGIPVAPSAAVKVWVEDDERHYYFDPLADGRDGAADLWEVKSWALAKRYSYYRVECCDGLWRAFFHCPTEHPGKYGQGRATGATEGEAFCFALVRALAQRGSGEPRRAREDP